MIDTRVFEGLRLRVYRDSVGKRTIGYGHNLDGGSDKNVRKLGLDPNDLRQGISITMDQAQALYELDMHDVESWIIELVPNYYSQPIIIQQILLDLGFNMGKGTLSTFHNTLRCFIAKDYSAVADNLEESLWYQQVGNRSREIVRMLRNV